MGKNKNMITVNLFDTNFAHSFGEDGFYTASMGRKPKLITWVKDNMSFDGVTVFTDEMALDPVVDRVQSKYKIAWCQESPGIKPYVYNNIIEVEHKFDYILTFHSELLKRNPKKYILNLCGSSRVADRDFKLHPKSKGISIIASDKTFTEGHRLRHEVVKKLEGVDCWGTGYKHFTNKLDPLKDYMFSIAIMNIRIDNFFTEVLTDCLALGTIPIFWGCPNVSDYFNSDGIIQFKDINDLFNLKLTKQLYESKIDAIKENIKIAKTMVSTDDIVAKNIIKLTS